MYYARKLMSSMLLLGYLFRGLVGRKQYPLPHLTLREYPLNHSTTGHDLDDEKKRSEGQTEHLISQWVLGVLFWLHDERCWEEGTWLVQMTVRREGGDSAVSGK